MIDLNNWPEIIITSLSSGTAVAFVNHFLQSRRKKQEIKFENKSVLIREKMKIIEEINKILNDIGSIFSNEYNNVKSYIKNIDKNEIKEDDRKIYKLNIEIEDNELKIRNAVSNLNLYLNYFPSVKKKTQKICFYGTIDEFLAAFEKVTNNAITYHNIADSLIKLAEPKIYASILIEIENKFREFNSAYNIVSKELHKEGEKIYNYLNNS